MSDATCGCCGMACRPNEFHPYAACLMFKGCHNGDMVRANLAALASRPPASTAEPVTIPESWLRRGGTVPVTVETVELLLRAVESMRSRPPAGSATGQEWQPIETAPKDGRDMFIVRAFNVTHPNVGARNYTSDAWCVWPGDDGGWVRWPHRFPPSHWLPLPAAPVAQQGAEPRKGASDA